MSSAKCPFADQLWYAGAISERKCEEILAKNGSPGAFLVRDHLLPGGEFNYILSVFSGSEIVHYDVAVFPTGECDMDGYSFTSLPDAITFYTENRLHNHYLSLPVKSVVAEITARGGAPVTTATQPAPPPRSTPLQSPTSPSPLPSYRSLSGVWGPAGSSGETSVESYSPPLTLNTQITTGSPDNSQDTLNTECPGNNRDVLKSAPNNTISGDEVTDSTEEASETPPPDSTHLSSSFDNVVTFSTFHPAPTKQGESAAATNPLSQQPRHQEPPSVGQDSRTEEDTTDSEWVQPEQSQDVTESRKHPAEGQEGEQQFQHTPKKVPPPVPVRGSSVLQSPTLTEADKNKMSLGQTERASKESPSHSERDGDKSPAQKDGGGSESLIEPSVQQPPTDALHVKGQEPHRSVKRLPSLKERKKKLEAQMTASSFQPSSGGKPGRLMINEALEAAAVSVPMPPSQHPLLVKRQEEAAARAREERESREERERQAREEKMEKEKLNRRFPFKRSWKGKKQQQQQQEEEPSQKEQQKRLSMSCSEKEELENVFKQLTHSRPTSPDPPEMKLSEEVVDGVTVAPGEKEPSPPTPEPALSGTHSPQTTPPDPAQVKPAGSPRSSTLDRASNPPPSSSPPSLPGSIDRRTWQSSRGNSRPGTLERPRPGSRPGTLERKPPPPPSSQPPPVPAEVRNKSQRLASMGSSIGFSGGRMELVDLIPGVPRQTLTNLTPSQSSSSSSTSPQRRYTTAAAGGGGGGSSGGPINVKRNVRERKSTIRRGQSH